MVRTLVLDTFNGSDGEATRALFRSLTLRGHAGELAVNLFRACKASMRAKVYRGGVRGRGSYSRMAYDKKNWALEQLTEILHAHPMLVADWGWAEDPDVVFDGGPAQVLYVDLLYSLGQVSFHSPARLGKIRTYTGKWDGTHESAKRIVAYCDLVLSDPALWFNELRPPLFQEEQ
jgi:hypothetical protein